MIKDIVTLRIKKKEKNISQIKNQKLSWGNKYWIIRQKVLWPKAGDKAKSSIYKYQIAGILAELRMRRKK